MILQRIRSLGISWTLDALEWTTETFLYIRDYDRPSLLNRFGFWLEARFSGLFSFFYRGSDEEIDAVRRSEIPRAYMSERQRAAGREFALAGIFYDDVLCNDCGAPLLVVDETNLCAACRALHPEMLLEDRK